MKKIFRVTAVSFILFSSFSFVACGSTPDQEKVPPETPVLEKTEESTEDLHKDMAADSNVIQTEYNMKSDSETGTSQDSLLTDNLTEETSDLQEENENLETVESEAEKTFSNEDILEDIIEPEVFDAELPPLPSVEIKTEEPKSIESELVGRDEISELPDLPELSSEENSENETDLPETIETDSDETTPPESSEDEVVDIVIEQNNSTEDEVEDITEEENSETESEEEIEEKPAAIIVPSRSVSMKNGQSLDVEYPGKGWIFLGCTDGSKNLSSSGRKTKPDSTSFTLIARVPGTVILHFYKEDILGDKYIDDYLEVTVSEIRSKSSVHVKAPDYSEAVPAKPEVKDSEKTDDFTNEANTESKETETLKEKVENKIIKENERKDVKASSTKNNVSKPEKTETEEKKEPLNKTDESIKILSAHEYLSQAKKARDEQNYTEMYNNLTNFLAISESNRDEALFLLGQLYEGNSEYRNIKKSVETYEELTENYPVSPYWEDANKRVVYLKRFYINIR